MAGHYQGRFKFAFAWPLNDPVVAGAVAQNRKEPLRIKTDNVSPIVKLLQVYGQVM